MRTNQGGEYAYVSKTPDSIEDYDNLSPGLRELVRNLPYKYCPAEVRVFENCDLSAVRQGYLKQIQQHASACYGPDHPQAQGLYLCLLKT